MFPRNKDAQRMAKINTVNVPCPLHIKGTFNFKGELFFLALAVKTLADKNVGFRQSLFHLRNFINDINKAFMDIGLAIIVLIALINRNNFAVMFIGVPFFVFDGFHHLVTHGREKDLEHNMGKLAIFAGVSEFPIRVKCATLAWHTLKAALAGDIKSVCTE